MANKRVDVVFAGGGMVGLTLAIALARSGLSVTVVDRETPDSVVNLAYGGRVATHGR